MKPPRIALRIQVLDEDEHVLESYGTVYFDVADLSGPDATARNRFHAEVAQALRTLADRPGAAGETR